jgi:secreted trypsin-like serine protease
MSRLIMRGRYLLSRLVRMVVVIAVAVGSAPMASLGSASAQGHTRPRHMQSVTLRAASERGSTGPKARAAIVGGAPAEDGTYPWLAYIWRKTGEETFVCSGTVVAPNVVLTAGHCAEQLTTGVPYEPSDYVVVTGNVDWTASPRTLSGVARVIVYPGFDRSSLVGDAALLVLSTPTSQPALTLASYPSDVALLAGGTSAIVAGWGETKKEAKDATTRLQWAPTVMQLPGYCESNQFTSPFYERYELCATYPPKFETGVCFGDSGGPLIAQALSGEDVELGLVSRGYGECSTQYPTVFTRADLIAPWVAEWIQAVKPSIQSTPAPVLSQAPTQKATSSPTVAPAKAPNGTLIDGIYRGRTNQSSGSISLVIAGHRLTALAAKVVYRCRSGRTITESLDGLSRNESEQLSSSHAFEVKFSSAGENDVITGAADPSRGTISGTLQGSLLVRGDGLCSTGILPWSARHARVAASKTSNANAGSYYGQTNGGGQIALTVASGGRRLERVEFSATYECTGGRVLHMAKSFVLPSDEGPLGRFGAFTVHLKGDGYRGRIDGTFGLASHDLVFGTLSARAHTRLGYCHTGLVPWAT